MSITMTPILETREVLKSKLQHCTDGNYYSQIWNPNKGMIIEKIVDRNNMVHYLPKMIKIELQDVQNELFEKDGVPIETISEEDKWTKSVDELRQMEKDIHNKVLITLRAVVDEVLKEIKNV